MGGYALASLRGTPVTAIGPLPPMVADAGGRLDLDDVFRGRGHRPRAVAATTSFGGQVLVPAGELAPGVHLSIVSDPSGAVFGRGSRRRALPWLRNEPGAVDWVELVANECESTLEFYENVLVVGASQTDVRATLVYNLFDVGEVSVAGAVDPARSGHARTLAGLLQGRRRSTRPSLESKN